MLEWLEVRLDGGYNKRLVYEYRTELLKCDSCWNKNAVSHASPGGTQLPTHLSYYYYYYRKQPLPTVFRNWRSLEDDLLTWTIVGKQLCLCCLRCTCSKWETEDMTVTDKPLFHSISETSPMHASSASSRMRSATEDSRETERYFYPDSPEHSHHHANSWPHAQLFQKAFNNEQHSTIISDGCWRYTHDILSDGENVCSGGSEWITGYCRGLSSTLWMC